MNKDNAKDFIPLVQALADGKNIQFITNGRWRRMGEIMFGEDASLYRVEPEPEYPVTRLTKDELEYYYESTFGFFEALRYISNAAIKQAILDGDVILPEKK